MMCRAILLCVLAASTVAAFKPTMSKMTKPTAKRAPMDVCVGPAVSDVRSLLDEDNKAWQQPAVMPAKLAPNHALLLAMREEVVAVTCACLFVLLYPSPAKAVTMELLTLDDLAASPGVLLLLLAGITCAYYTGAAAHEIAASTEAIGAMVAPAFNGAHKHDGALPDAPCAYKDWLAGRPLPAIDELADACVIIATGPHGSWSLCSTPSDSACEPDDTFSAHYGQPVFICPT